MRHEHASPPGNSLGHQHGFGSRRRAVPHGSVGDFLSSELTHQCLKFKDRLQRALGNLRLIRCVGGKEFAALNNCIGNHGAQMVVNAGAAKTGVAARIFSGALAEISNDFRFGEWAGQLQRFAQAKTLRNAGKKFVDRFSADGGKHLLALGWAFGEIAHQAEASLPLLAMNASYAAASINDFSSAPFARRTLMSHAALCGSVLIFSGVFCRSALASTTSPETGA